ncbi:MULTISPECIES: HAD-IIA family hydrolase [Kitasatospora]|uniref:HAD superfamily hydrolase (TIGR01458 family) n=2 Tax=Kitasatospora TaxID=2063 RepID=A0ABT1J8B9_9ACTN|nr:HAD-IIA family hydrolase [Kitasatospora paracochleata]MCP2313680.1 HAD superfamily hydrolase (TIGR01458 family) [Kitasatospora paracochleata]
MGRAEAALLDIDGVLTIDWLPLPGAVAAVRELHDDGVPYVLLTNTTSRTRTSIAETLAAAGFPVGVDSVLTAPAAAAARLAGSRCLLLNSGDIREDLTGLHLVEDPAEAEVVLVGGAGPEFDYRALDRAFNALRGGARLVAMHRNAYWRTAAGLRLDSGAFVAALEYAADVRAEVLGKPAEAFFAGALKRLGVGAAQAVMVGDDIESDVLAAQRYEITGVLVRTGKAAGGPRHGSGEPDHVLDSVADLPGLLARLRRG